MWGFGKVKGQGKCESMRSGEWEGLKGSNVGRLIEGTDEEENHNDEEEMRKRIRMMRKR